ncbi:hypothetical protein K4F52_001421 [Lecanicillium sp. MT-2017a]|nr:hypothetical protein K4F52_001421 [Lecanicillium sp. MT-2017a]
MKSLKMIGLEVAMSNTVQKLRVEEISCFKYFKFLSSLLKTTCTGLFSSSSPGSFTPVKAFMTLAIAALIINPLMAILGSYPKLQSSMASFNRIETYLLAPEVNSDQYCDSNGTPLTEQDVEPRTEDFQRLPNGDSYVVGINGGRLSGGQRHRIALARALYLRASVLVLDDIFRGLDKATADDVHNRLFGSKGVLRKSATTVVFATHSAAFMKTAHQAIIIDANGAVSVQPNASAIVLSKTYIEQLAQQEDSVNGAVRTARANGQVTTVDTLDDGSGDQLQPKSDVSLYRYFARLTSTWKICLWLLSVAMLVATERSPEVFVRIWLDFHIANDQGFMIYVSIGASGIIVSLFCLWAPISFLTSTEIGCIISRFNQDMTTLTENLPSALFHVAYLTVYVMYDASIIISGLKYAAALVPFLILLIYVIQTYYLRISRQLRHLDAEAKTPIYTLYTEMAAGLEHIRAFGWQSTFTSELMQALDNSQKPYYYTFAVQRWLELSIDMSSLALAVVLVSITTIYKDSTSEAAMGLTMLNLVTFGNMLNLAVVAWSTLETALGAVMRFRHFVDSTPSENVGDDIQLPTRWPRSGNIVFSNVTAKYQITTIAQDTISLGGSIRENILPYEGQLEDETVFDELVFEALDKVELTELVEIRGGLDVPLSTMGMSEGQMQLLALARAIMHNTCTQSKVILFDEPTSSMDAETDSRIQGIIEEEFVGCTKLIVSHRSETFWDASRLLEVRNGHVVELPIPERPDDEDSD